MEKTTMLGVRKKKAIRKRSKHRFLRKVTEYLKSDCYLYAPLVSTHTFPFRAPKSTTEIEGGKDDKRSLVQRIGEYMKVNPYMYAHVVDLQPATPLNPPTPTDKSVIKERQPRSVQSVDAMVDKQLIEEYSSEITNTGRLNFAHTETVKHMVYQSCQPSSISGKEMSKARPKKVAVQ